MAEAKKAEVLKIEAVSTSAKIEKTKKSKSDGAGVFPCICESKFQDVRYGKSRRVFCLAEKKRTCTVCGRAQ